jgi:signal transduction histidine kinase
MQTNLSTIRLNTESFVTNTEQDILRKQKVLHQISILGHRIKDIVTVGGSDQLELTNINSTDFCNDLIDEFDNSIFSSIQFKIQAKDFVFLGDKQKLVRAVRNSIENSIKNMKENGGVITLGAEKNIHNIILYVKDTGKGMDKSVLNKFLTPFFSTARKEGGYGIGTIIMQRVMELHGGKIEINSEKWEGTEVRFIIPDFTR